MLNQVIFEGRRHDHDVIAAAIEEARNRAEGTMQRTPFPSSSDRGQRLGPQVAHFKDKRNAFPPCQPPSGERDQQLRRCANDNVRTQPADRCRHPERSIVADPLVSFPVRQRPQPGSHDAHSVHGFFAEKAMQPGPPLHRNHARRMVGKPREHGYIVSHPDPMASQLVRACRGRSHLRREVLRNVENLHGALDRNP